MIYTVMLKRKTTQVISFVRRYLWVFAASCVVLAALLWGPTIYANLSTRSIRYDLDRTPVSAVPKRDVGIVLGAGIYHDGTPTPYLQWRINTAVQLYKAHSVHKLLMTGDNSRTHYDEPSVMAKYAERAGVPKQDIVVDDAGFNTYDSCYRAQAIFRVRSAIVISQGYHLPRAVMACNSLGVRSIGVDADHDKGRSWKVMYIVREWFSTDKIVLQLMFKPHPTLLGPPLPISAT